MRIYKKNRILCSQSNWYDYTIDDRQQLANNLVKKYLGVNTAAMPIKLDNKYVIEYLNGIENTQSEDLIFVMYLIEPGKDMREIGYIYANIIDVDNDVDNCCEYAASPSGGLSTKREKDVNFMDAIVGIESTYLDYQVKQNNYYNF